MTSDFIDIRSDTVTHPTPAMRKAMAEAEVGDDVYGDDPTVKKLEELGAKMLGKEAALFVPTGTFGNQLALFTWCERGSEVLLGEECHIIQHEAGAASIIAEVQTRTIPAPDGVLSADLLKERIRKRDLHAPGTSLICMENAHSFGRAVSLENMAKLKNLAQEHKLPVHLDGARIFNAAIALGVDVSNIASYADSVMFCLSKGLCAPVGSLLAGQGHFIDEARLKRKIMGGGMRQAGILASAGIISLTDHTKKIEQDHKMAQKLAQGLKDIPGIIINTDEVDINLVFFTWPPAKEQAIAKKAMDVLLKNRVLCNPPENGVFRYATHFWTGEAEVKAILEASKKAFKGN